VKEVRELTIKQASQLAQERGHAMGISYLNRLARTNPERIGARFVEQPTGWGYYLVDEEKLLDYIATTKPRSKKHQSNA
jgi:hypothetical protein